jgi:CHASE2 domain-containing sensor protein
MKSLDRTGRPPKAVSLRKRVILATVIASAGLLSLGRNALLYGWTLGTVLAGIVTVPVGVVLYLFVLRRWARGRY